MEFSNRERECNLNSPTEVLLNSVGNGNRVPSRRLIGVVFIKTRWLVDFFVEALPDPAAEVRVHGAETRASDLGPQRPSTKTRCHRLGRRLRQRDSTGMSTPDHLSAA